MKKYFNSSDTEWTRLPLPRKKQFIAYSLGLIHTVSPSLSTATANLRQDKNAQNIWSMPMPVCGSDSQGIASIPPFCFVFAPRASRANQPTSVLFVIASGLLYTYYIGAIFPCSLT